MIQNHGNITLKCVSIGAGSGDPYRVRALSRLKHQPSAPDLFLNRVNRGSVHNFQKLTGEIRSYSTGKMNHLDNFAELGRSAAGSSSSLSKHQQQPQQHHQQHHQQPRGVMQRSNSFREPRNIKVNTDLAPGTDPFIRGAS